MLKIIKFLSPLLQRLGIDCEKLSLILYYKKLELSRKEENYGNKASLKLNALQKILFSNVLMSLFLMIFLFVLPNIEIVSILLAAMVLIIVTMLLISDLSEILLSDSDKDLLKSKPIDSNLINIAKFLILFEHLILYTLSLSFLSLIVVIFKWGIINFLLMFAMLFLLDIIVAILSTIIYFVVLKYYGGLQIQNLITYFQLVMMFIMLILQFSVNSQIKVLNTSLIINYNWWNILLIPFWYGSWFSGQSGIIITINRILSITMPLVLILFYLTYLAKHFENYLNTANLSEQEQKKKTTSIFAKLLCKNRQELAGYELSIAMLKTDQKIRRVILPYAIMPLLYMIIAMINDSNISAVTLYIICIPMQASVAYWLKFTTMENIASLYQSFPNNQLYYLKRGVLKLLSFKYFLPIYIILMANSFILDNISAIIFILNNFLLTLIMLRISSNSTRGTMYFTVNFTKSRGEEKMPQGFMLLMILYSVIASIPNIYYNENATALLLIAMILLIINYILYFTDLLKKDFVDVLGVYKK